MLTRRYQLLLIAIIVLGAYYPAVLSDFSKIDDGQLASSYREMQGWNLYSLFIPSANEGLYYRPLIGLSFLIDKHLLGLHPGMMHLENVLLHVANALLVFFIAFRIMPQNLRNQSYLPLLAAVFFGLHPINTESVNWISGRTDVLAGTFILTSASCLLIFMEKQSKKYAVLSCAALLGGALTKETALAFIPGAFLMINSVRKTGHIAKSEMEVLPSPGLTWNSKIVITGIVLTGLLFYFLRSVAFTSSINRIGLTIMSFNADWVHSMFVILRAFGFYIKKLIFPFPLNLAIVDVDPLYEVLAVPLIALSVFIATRRTMIAAVFTAGLLLIIPSFVLAFGQIAWTPYAERYIYIPAAFVVASSSVHCWKSVLTIRTRALAIFVLVILCVLFASTLHRSIVWHNDLYLCRDTVEKSPMARDMRLIYATVLTEKGDYDGALNQLNEGRKIPFFGYDERFDLNTADVYYKQGRIDDAIKITETAIQNTKATSIRGLSYLINLLEEKESVSRKSSEKRLLNKRIYNNLLLLYGLKKDPHLLYDLAETAEALGDRRTAIALYNRVGESLKETDPDAILASKKIHALTKSKVQ